MTQPEFDEKYTEQGGFQKLQELMNQSFTGKFIGNHFGVSRSAVRLWSQEFFGKTYDPRPSRKEKTLESMLLFAEHHNYQEFKDAYYYASPHYYQEALAEIINRKIYKTEEII